MAQVAFENTTERIESFGLAKLVITRGQLCDGGPLARATAGGSLVFTQTKKCSLMLSVSAKRQVYDKMSDARAIYLQGILRDTTPFKIKSRKPCILSTILLFPHKIV